MGVFFFNFTNGHKKLFLLLLGTMGEVEAKTICSSKKQLKFMKFGYSHNRDLKKKQLLDKSMLSILLHSVENVPFQSFLGRYYSVLVLPVVLWIFANVGLPLGPQQRLSFEGVSRHQ